MQECTGKHRISSKVLRDDKGYGSRNMRIGVNLDATGWNEDLFDEGDEIGFGIYLEEGFLCGNGVDGNNEAGQVLEGQVLTMELDTDAHALKFWVDGQLDGAGFTSGVVGSLRWALSIGAVSNATQILRCALFQAQILSLNNANKLVVCRTTVG
jgi:hypothetical protein